MRTVAKIICMALLCLASTHLSAQNILGKPVTDYSSQAPSVTEMQKYIDVPVSYFTGTTNIIVPVHTVTSKTLSIPLTLSYHSGGIKAEDEAPYVGAGWSLSGVGSITRTVRGNEVQIQVTIDYTREGGTGGTTQKVTYFVGQHLSFTKGMAVVTGTTTQFKAAIITQTKQTVTK